MASGKLQHSGNTFLVPTFAIHSDDCPACLIRIFKVMKMHQFQLKLDSHGVLFQESLHFFVVGFVAKFLVKNPHNFTEVDGWVKMFQIENIFGNGVRKPQFLFSTRV